MFPIFTYIGIIVSLFFLLKLSFWVYRTFFFKEGYKKYIVPNKSWAIVTGATSGIGRGFAEKLAKLKSNLLLVSRDSEKLERLCDILSEENGIKAEYVVLDFAKNDYSKELNTISENLVDKQVSILVNNIGINYDIPNYFLEIKKEEADKVVNVNIFSAMNMTRTVLPFMLENKKGLIVNLSSFTNIFKTPLLTVYGATKGFLDIFSQSLHYEYCDRGITSIAIKPMYVLSAMTGFKKESISICSGERIANDTLNNVGGFLQPLSFIPYWYHAIQIFIFTLIPAGIFASQQKGRMELVKKVQLKKKEKLLKKE